MKLSLKHNLLPQVDQVPANSPALLLVDPAYHGNIGDNLIAYGELVLLERLGLTNHTECHIIQSQELSQSCDNFSHIDNGGLAWWHGGGNWGDIYSWEELNLRWGTGSLSHCVINLILIF